MISLNAGRRAHAGSLFPRHERAVAALVARCAGHTWLNALCEPATGNVIAIAEITEAEIAAAQNQLVRGGTLKRKRCATALALFWDQVDHGRYAVVAISSPLIRRAAALCDHHALKGYDAVQLACALTFREDVRQANLALPGGGLGDPIFITADKHLSDAAKAEGFIVDSPLAHP